jgi:hypothetical protein
MKAELTGQRGHAEAAVCEGLVRPDDTAGTDNMDAATAPPLLPAIAWAAACFLAQYQESIATGALAKLVFAEATNASISPAVTLCACARRAVVDPPTLGGENGKNAGGRPGWREGKQWQQQQQQQEQSQQQY